MGVPVLFNRLLINAVHRQSASVSNFPELSDRCICLNDDTHASRSLIVVGGIGGEQGFYLLDGVLAAGVAGGGVLGQ